MRQSRIEARLRRWLAIACLTATAGAAPIAQSPHIRVDLVGGRAHPRRTRPTFRIGVDRRSSSCAEQQRDDPIGCRRPPLGKGRTGPDRGCTGDVTPVVHAAAASRSRWKRSELALGRRAPTTGHVRRSRPSSKATDRPGHRRTTHATVRFEVVGRAVAAAGGGSGGGGSVVGHCERRQAPAGEAEGGLDGRRIGPRDERRLARAARPASRAPPHRRVESEGREPRHRAELPPASSRRPKSGRARR